MLAQLVTHRLLHRVSAEKLLRILALAEVAPPSEEGEQVVVEPEETLEDLLEDVPTQAALADYARACLFLVRELDIEPGEHALIVNGRVSDILCFFM